MENWISIPEVNTKKDLSGIIFLLHISNRIGCWFLSRKILKVIEIDEQVRNCRVSLTDIAFEITAGRHLFNPLDGLGDFPVDVRNRDPYPPA